MISKELLEILACPKCKGPLKWDQGENKLECPNCKVRFPITDDIPELLIDKAEPIKGS